MKDAIELSDPLGCSPAAGRVMPPPPPPDAASRTCRPTLDQHEIMFRAPASRRSIRAAAQGQVERMPDDRAALYAKETDHVRQHRHTGRMAAPTDSRARAAHTAPGCESLSGSSRRIRTPDPPASSDDPDDAWPVQRAGTSRGLPAGDTRRGRVSITRAAQCRAYQRCRRLIERSIAPRDARRTIQRKVCFDSTTAAQRGNLTPTCAGVQ
jgi:hypothetical protein